MTCVIRAFLCNNFPCFFPSKSPFFLHVGVLIRLLNCSPHVQEPDLSSQNIGYHSHGGTLRNNEVVYDSFRDSFCHSCNVPFSYAWPFLSLSAFWYHWPNPWFHGNTDIVCWKNAILFNLLVCYTQQALESGALAQGGIITEGSAGSTAISLATVAPAFGCKCHVVIPDDAAIEKVNAYGNLALNFASLLLQMVMNQLSWGRILHARSISWFE